MRDNKNMSIKMNLIRQILTYEKEKQTSRFSRSKKLNNIYEILSITDTSRTALASLARFALRNFKTDEILICNTPCLSFNLRNSSKYFSNTKPQKDILILYIHGGGFCSGFAEQGTYLIKVLTKYFGCNCIAPRYPLSPEHIYPTALEKLEKIYNKLSKQYKHIIFLGESAGANLALSLMLRLKKKKKTLPACAILLSGFFDLSREIFTSTKNNSTDVSLSDKQLKYMGIAYTHGENIEKENINNELLKQPFVSPVNANLTGLPPIFFSVCKDEILYDDTIKMIENCKRDKVHYVLHENTKCFHAYAIMGDFLSESSKVSHEIVKFLTNYTNFKMSYSKPATVKKKVK